LQDNFSFIAAFKLLGLFLRQFSDGNSRSSVVDDPYLTNLNGLHFKELSDILESEPAHNPWFTPEYLGKALNGIASMLEEDVLEKWLRPYSLSQPASVKVKTIGLVMAGNIPLVGFHDLMSVLATGHRVLARPSSKDDRLIKKIAGILSTIDPEIGGRISFTEDILSGMDAVIATGSNNSARYFEYYFRNIPHIIRKNRNGVAVLTGNESDEELAALGEDIFTYFGMGCRNVTKLYIPEAYDLKILLKVLDRFQYLYRHHKYGNNVDYYRTIYLMNRVPFLDNGVLLLKEDAAISSPVGVVFYERYSEIDALHIQLDLHREEIQCIVSADRGILHSILPGSTQKPMPWDYADGVDTIRFLMELT
jgi:hypothetical protein